MPPKPRDWPERAQGRAFGMQGGVVAAGGAAIPWPRIGPARATSAALAYASLLAAERDLNLRPPGQEF